MRFLVDECTGPAVAQWLRDQGHEVLSAFDEARGMDDDAVIQKAFMENRILVTNDKDFGERVYRQGHKHRGVVLLRLEDERAPNRIKVIRQLLADHEQKLPDRFVVVTEDGIRFAR